jgi:hypothetical protein
LSFEKDSYSLAKGLHHINIAKQYFEDVKIGCTGDLKNTFNGYINKCHFILNNIYDKLSDERRDIFKKELSDSLCLDAINDQLMMIDIEKRNEIELLMLAINKGKKVTIKIED